MKRSMLWGSGLVFAAMSLGCDNVNDTSDTVTAADSEAALGAYGALKVPCERLVNSLQFPFTAFTSSTSIAAGTLTLAGKAIGAHCLLTGKMHERVSPVDGQTYSIGFEMRLPLDWNGRFFYQANGGLDGNVVTATGNTSGGGPLTSALLQGFAVISSDAGHSAAQNPTFGIDPQARLDFGYQAVGKLTPMAKSVIRTAYGKRPSYSYIGGCSNGGRHAMVAAARYADKFDGYLVGSPGFHLPRAAVASIYGAQQYAPLAVPGATIPAGPFAGLPDLSGAFTTAEQQLLVSKVLERCDAIDGVADGIIGGSAACQSAFRLDRDVPTCGSVRDGSCLSAAQKVAIGDIFAGPKNNLGQPIYSGFPFDAGLVTSGNAFWEFISPLILDAGAVGLVFSTPPADPATFIAPLFALTSNVDQLATSIAATDATYTESSLSFMDPPRETELMDLQRLGRHMVVYQGVSDPIFSAQDTARWFSRLRPSVQNLVRLYLVPGMNHCSDGPSTDQFDLLTPLMRWVEKGEPPRNLVATARGSTNPGGANPDVPAEWAPDRTRPLCAFPEVPTYTSGDIERAESFVCRCP
ncbi:MAG TPA: tannase/feruloyl esterase family alpha/beta hydrolase [Polyangiaceae bacterium]